MPEEPFVIRDPVKSKTETKKSDLCNCVDQFGNLGQTMTILNDLMLAESFTKVHFVLNGNNRAHKSAASIIASQMKHLDENLYEKHLAEL